MAKNTCLENDNMNISDKKNLESEVLKQLKELAIYAHLRLINESGDIIYETQVFQTKEEFEFNKKFQIEYKEKSISQSSGTFFVQFLTKGKLNEILKFYKFPTEFTIYVMNEKFRETLYLDETSNLNKIIFHTSFENTVDYQKINFHSNGIIEEINKLLLFLRIKYS